MRSEKRRKKPEPMAQLATFLASQEKYYSCDSNRHLALRFLGNESHEVQ
jgi:hypothetical protein